MIFLECIFRPLVYSLAHPKVQSLLRAPPNTPVLLYANHVTAVDVPLMLYGLPGRLRRRVAVAMSGEILLAWRERRYYRSRILNWLSPLEYLVVTALFNVFPLPQKTGFRKSFSHAALIMDSGFHIIVFPEGHRASDERIQEFRSGAGLLWGDLRCPALPIYLGGLGELKRTEDRWFLSGRLFVRIGDLISSSSGASPQDATATLEAALRELAENASTNRQ